VNDNDGSSMKPIGFYTVSLAELVSEGESPHKRLRANDGEFIKNGSISVRASAVGSDSAVRELQAAAKAAREKMSESEGKLTVLYVNPLAPPSLACWALVQAALPGKVVVREVPSTHSTDFLFPDIFTGPPLLDDAGFKLGESTAILRYLCQKFKLHSRWLPTQVQDRARLEEALGHHLTNVRKGSAYMYHKYVAPHQDEAAIAEGRTWCDKNLMALENQLAGRSFIAGEALSIADLAYFTEFAFLVSDLKEHVDPQKFPHVHRWLEVMSKQPWHDAVLGEMFQHINKKSQQEETS